MMSRTNDLTDAYNRIRDLTADLRLSRFERRHLDEAIEDFYHAKVDTSTVCNAPSPDGQPCWKLSGHVGAHQAATGEPYIAAAGLAGCVELDLSDVDEAG